MRSISSSQAGSFSISVPDYQGAPSVASPCLQFPRCPTPQPSVAPQPAVAVRSNRAAREVGAAPDTDIVTGLHHILPRRLILKPNLTYHHLHSNCRTFAREGQSPPAPKHPRYPEDEKRNRKRLKKGMAEEPIAPGFVVASHRSAALRFITSFRSG